MSVDEGKKSFLAKEIKIKNKWPIVFIAVWLALCYLFAVARELRFISPIEALFSLTPLYAIEIAAVSIGMTYLLIAARKKRRHQSFQLKMPLRLSLVFCLFFCVSFFLECTLFQYNHYGTLFGDGQLISSENANTDWKTLRFGSMDIGAENAPAMSFYFSLVKTFDGSEAENQEKLDKLNKFMHTPSNSMDQQYTDLLEEKERIGNELGEEAAYPLPVSYKDDMAVAQFRNINSRISSIYIEPFFLPKGNPITEDAIKSYDVMVLYSDEDNTLRQTEKHTIVDGSEYTRYIPVYSVGNVSELSVIFFGEGTAFSTIKVNEQIPLEPVLLRMLIITTVLFVIYLLRRYSLFAVPFDETSKMQKWITVGMFAVILAYCLVLAVNTVSFPYEEYSAGQYNHYLVDSILEGRADLDIPTSERFAAIDRKYDLSYWSRLYGIDYLSEDVHWDTVYFQGKWYTYFGVVPALLFFVPYTAITGKYLPYEAACFIQGAAALTFLLLIWRRFFKKYLKQAPFSIYLLTSATLAMCSFVPFLLRRSFFYETINLGGLMFCAAGFWLLLRWYDKQGRHLGITLAGACLCFALAVGCRPTMLLSSSLVPLFMWPEIREKWKNNKAGLIKLLCTVAVPYISVAIPLMWYNYIRFGSPFDFGSTYQVTALNLDVQNLMNPIGRLYRAIFGVVANFFNAPAFSVKFPFVTVDSVEDTGFAHIAQYLGAIGLLTIPASWFLLGLKGTKNLRKQNPFIGHFVLAAVLIGVITAGASATYCIQPRYEIDYAWLIMLASLSCLYFIYEKRRDNVQSTLIINKLVAGVCCVSIIMFFFLSLRGEVTMIEKSDSLPLYFYLKRAFSFFEGV